MFTKSGRHGGGLMLRNTQTGRLVSFLAPQILVHIPHFRSATTWSRGIAPESNLFGAVFNCASQGGEKSGQIKYLGEVSATLKQHHSISPHSFVSCNC